MLTVEQQHSLEDLLYRQSAGNLTARQEATLEELMQSYGQLTLRKAHAYLLLARRGYRVPMQEDFYSETLMARPHIAKRLRQKIVAQAGYRCGYCQTAQSFTAMPLHLEHIVPLAKDGSSTEDNLWLACPLCNGHKGTQTNVTDPDG